MFLFLTGKQNTHVHLTRKAAPNPEQYTFTWEDQ
jgi:hypothetical protein